MKVLVLGAGGMLGHKMVEILSRPHRHIFASVRSNTSFYSSLSFFEHATFIPHLDVSEPGHLKKELNQLQPDFIINCIGMTTRKMSSQSVRDTVYINAMLPHLVDQWCEHHNSHQIHFSTDCVFNGKDGFPYNENSPKTATDLYGQSKSLGEVTHSKHTLTLRTSIIGREIRHFTELVEWFLSQKGKSIKGFNNVIYSGLTTNAVSALVDQILEFKEKPSGLMQLSSAPISKYELLSKLNEAFSNNNEIFPHPEVVSNKTLISDFFKSQTQLTIPTWDEMIQELADTQHLYKELYLKAG